MERWQRNLVANWFLGMVLLCGRALAADKPSPRGNEVVLDNGLVRLSLSNPEGHVTGVAYGGIENLLEVKNAPDSRGYWDAVWNKPGASANADSVSTEGSSDKVPEGASIFMDKMLGAEYKVIMDNENQKEVSFSKQWSSKLGNDVVPLNIDKRYVLLKGVPGFYTYTITERLDGYPGCDVQELRVAFKLSNKFDYIAVSDSRQRYMASYPDRENGRVLDYKEAVQLKNPVNKNFNGEVDDKYLFSSDNKDNKVHGWVNTEAGVGFWTVRPSDEFLAGGPTKQDLTSHTGPISVSMFFSDHYGGAITDWGFKQGEPFRKVLGPIFVYLNQDIKAKADPSLLWKDAKARMEKEVAAWPYNFLLSPHFVKPTQRGSIKGQLQVRDRVSGVVVPAAWAFVGLAMPGKAGSWQLESKGYQFWTQADAKGFFEIRNVIPGKYNLNGYVSGYIGNYHHPVDINIVPGPNPNLPELVFEPPRNGQTLWEIGIPDRKASEFFIPDPPAWVHLYPYKVPIDRWRQYGLWERYSDIYLKGDLVFTVGVSDYKKDWFFAHVSRKTGQRQYQGTTWQIVFNLEQAVPDKEYTLQVAIASSNLANLQVRVNYRNSKPLMETGMLGRDNAIARHGDHGLYYLYSVSIPGKVLFVGKNTVFLTQTRAADPFQGMMYDYIRFEGPSMLPKQEL